VSIYQGLCDPLRLRILHLLQPGELCVCHLQEILKAPQVRISKHLAYLRTRGLVEVRREANWMVYRLPAKPARELAANLACLQDCVGEDPVFRRDLAKRHLLERKFARTSPVCCAPTGKKSLAPSRSRSRTRP